MDRRAFRAGTLGLLAAPSATAAQPAGTVPRIGLLDTGSLVARAPLWEAFRQGMRELGYVEGRTVVLEARGADGSRERLPALAAELVELKVEVIVTASNSAAWTVRQATATIPIVMVTGDPLASGLVTSLSRPGGNVTGLTTQSIELSAKRLDLARELVPGASRLAILWEGEGAGSGQPRVLLETEAGAKALGMRLDAVRVRSPADFAGAFSKIAREHPAVLLVTPSPLFFGEGRRLAELAVKHRLPTVHALRELVEAGGLIAYGVDTAERFRRAAMYVDKILRGAKPVDLPIQQPTS